ncbi:MAG: glycoside hydrolase family 5 protein [Treponema sp.]|nr:glycoside hydrolase family 5 protein [Treponema sp.]
MKRKIFHCLALLFVILSFSACGALDDDEVYALDFSKSLSNGWNLGNTLDAKSDGDKTNKGLSTETLWGMPETTEAMIKAVYAKGFRTIRIPVSWHNHITDSSFTIDSEWMARVKTVVDWSLAAGLKVIINIHHDNLSESQMSSTYGFCITSDSEKKAASLSYIKSVWSQIAQTFKDYDNRLVFELLNEPRAVGTKYEWSTGSYAAEVRAANVLIMEYEKAALDTIRATGGNNLSRFIMIPPYAASPDMTAGWSLPKDSSKAPVSHLIVSVHAYTPYVFCMGTSSNKTFTNSTRDEIDWLFSGLNSNWVSNGTAVVIGEMSASDKNNTEDRSKWASYYGQKAKSNGIPVILWDNMVRSTASGGNGSIESGECHGYFDRKNLSWWFEGIVKEIAK